MTTDVEFERLYHKVFDDKGNIKACGRETCIALINKCESMANIPCGDKKTGFVNVDVVKQVYTQYQNDNK